MRLFLKIFSSLLVFISVSTSAFSAAGSAPFSLYLPNIGQGNCIFLSNREKTFVGIFDCGSFPGKNEKWDVKLKKILEKLIIPDQLSKWLIVLSHPDHDHYNFLPEIIELITPKLKDDSIELTLILGGPLEKYFYYQGHYPLSDIIKFLIDLRKPKIRVISISHDLDHEDLLRVINQANTFGQEIDAKKALFAEQIEHLLSDHGYIENALRDRIEKAKEKASKKGLGEPDEAKILESLQKELKDSKIDKSDLLEKQLKQHFRNVGFSSPLGANRLRGYREDTDIIEFIGSDIVPEDIEIRILSANGGQSSRESHHRPITVINDDENTNSMIMQITHRETKNSILLPGDATGATTDRVLNSFHHRHHAQEGKIQYVVASHHGADSHETNNREWVEAIQPKFVLFSAEGVQYNHPRCSTVSHYLRYAHPTTPHALTCFKRRSDPLPHSSDPSLHLSEIQEEYVDKHDDKVTIGNVTKEIYCGDNPYPEGPYPFPHPDW